MQENHKRILWQKREGLDEMLHIAVFHWGIHCFKVKWSLKTEVHLNLEILMEYSLVYKNVYRSQENAKYFTDT